MAKRSNLIYSSNEMAHFRRFKKISDLKKSSEVLLPKNSIFIFDKSLLKIENFNCWIKTTPYHVPVRAGEGLKTLKSFEQLVRRVHQLAKMNQLGKDFAFVAIGGGSVTDAVGFLASIFQRGHPLLLLPTTWLCAVDSAFGGKNGLNISDDKNQLGTVREADQILIVDELLKAQPPERVLDGFSESIKMGLINSARLFRSIEPNRESLIKNLSLVVDSKMRVVRKDPYESMGIRYVLNFGHTFGHIFETRLKISHGLAVLIGQIVATDLSFRLGYCAEKTRQRVLEKLFHALLQFDQLKAFERATRISSRSIRSQLMRDKKFKHGFMNFVFLIKIGRCRAEKIAVEQLLTAFAQSQKALRSYV